MKKLSLLLLFISTFLHSQTIHKSIESATLNQTRELKIWLPRNYDETLEKLHPIIVVLDGDYLFEPVAGNVCYYSYMEEIPEAIVVGINQAKFHPIDIFRHEHTSYLTTESNAFYDFLKTEMIPYIKNTYRTSDFEVIIAHGRTSNFINYFLLKDPDLFDAYVNLSPAFAPEMRKNIAKKLSSIENNVWYYLATSTNDVPLIREEAHDFKKELDSIKNKKVHFYFDEFEGKDHASLVSFGIPAALEKIFSPYGPILKKEYENIVLNEDNYCTYLRNKYESIETIYHLELKIKVNDIMAIAAAIKKNEKWEELAELSMIAKENYPETMLPYYFEAVFYERTGKPKKALLSYKKAYNKKEISFLTRDLIWKKIGQINADFGY